MGVACCGVSARVGLRPAILISRRCALTVALRHQVGPLFLAPLCSEPLKQVCAAAKSLSVTFVLQAEGSRWSPLISAAAVFKRNQSISRVIRLLNLRLRSPRELKIQKNGHNRQISLTGLIFAADGIEANFYLDS
jgi:hypothetical protein